MPSQKILEEKKKAVSEIAESLKSSCTGVIVDYKGITVEDDTKLRKELREAGCNYKVIKNTMLRLAFKEAGMDGFDDVLEGSTAIATNKDDYVAPSKILNKFAEDSKTFKIKSGFIDGKAVSVDEIKTLASLPPKEVLIGQVLRGLNGPISGLVTVLNGTIKGLVVALNAIAEKQQKSA